MSDRLPHLPLFVDDYDAATAHMTLEEDGAYLRLLRLCWRSPRCTIPADDDWIMRRLRVDQGTYDRVVRPLIKEFFKQSRGRLFQKRLLQEYGNAVDRQQRRKEAGKKGGEAKASKNKDKGASNALAKAEQTHGNAVASNPTQPISTSLEEPDGSSRETTAGQLPVRVRDEPDEVEIAFAAYDAVRRELVPAARAITLDRKRSTALRSRLAEIGGLARWNEVLALIRGSPFLRGDDARGGRLVATIDWILNPTNLRKILEGNYNDASSSAQRPASHSQGVRRSTCDALLEAGSLAGFG